MNPHPCQHRNTPDAACHSVNNPVSFSATLKKNVSDNRFKLARIAAGYRQRDLAAASGLGEHQICLIETGRWNPPAEVKQRLAELLQKPTFEVFL